MQEQPTQFTEYRTVQKFLGDLAIKDYTESEIQERLGILKSSVRLWIARQIRWWKKSSM